MADLLAKQTSKVNSVSRGQEITGEVIAINGGEIVIDLGAKAEGVMQRKDLSSEKAAALKVGDKITASVIQSENQSGQIVLSPNRPVAPSKGGRGGENRFKRFDDAKSSNHTVRGRATEVNRGGLIVEVDGIRGFLPSSQASLSSASNLEELVGKDLDLLVIEVDPSQNRLIFSQKAKVTDETKEKLSKLKTGQKTEGAVAAVLPFGIFVSLADGVEGLVHISEISWDKVEDPNTFFKIGDKVEALVTSIDVSSGRVNLSVKQLSKDPFVDKTKEIHPEDVIKGTVTKITQNGLIIELQNSIEGYVPSSAVDAEGEYEVGKSANFLVGGIDNQKRRVNLTPFRTSTKDLIYK